MNEGYHAVLADFGLVSILSPSSMTTRTSNNGAGTMRWMAPELLIPEDYGFDHCKPSKESDMFAVGMVIYEVRPVL